MAGCSLNILTDDSIDIVVIGRCTSQTAWFEWMSKSRSDEKQTIDRARFYSYGLLCGGNGAAQALLASRLGASVAFIGRACRNKITQQCLKTLRQFAVNIGHVIPCYTCTNNKAENVSLNGSQHINSLDCSYLSVQDILAAENLIKKAKVVIVNYEIGADATLQALKFCKDKISILYASPLPENHTAYLLKRATYVIFNARLDLEAQFTSEMYEDNPVNDFMYNLLRNGIPNVFVMWNGVFVVVAGTGLERKTEALNKASTEIFWNKTYAVKDRNFKGFQNNAAGSDGVASLAVVLTYHVTYDEEISLTNIVDYTASLSQLCHESKSFNDGKCTPDLATDILEEYPAIEQEYFSVLFDSNGRKTLK